MTTYLVTRHPGTLQWMQQHGPAFDCHVAHLEPARIQPGDTVIGTLPVHLAARVSARGGKYWNLVLDTPAHWRGQELSAEQLNSVQAHLQEFHIEPRP
jgi:CRISPR-associated protein Csx16